MLHAINGDLTKFCAVDTNRMEWQPSPSGTVWRKRVHLVGPTESGQVTSVVRYESDSSFPVHDHPQGEEIFVLEGVFSDQQGDWPAGTYLLNPEGFRHAPFSRSGCVLLVKLRQYSGADRTQIAIDTNSLPWHDGDLDGVACKQLYAQQGYSDRVELQKWQPGTGPYESVYPDGAEMFVIEGAFRDERSCYGKGCWLRFPKGATHYPQTDTGCIVYVKKAGLRYLLADEGPARR